MHRVKTSRCSWLQAARHGSSRVQVAAVRSIFIGLRTCSIRPAWCENMSSGTMSCAVALRLKPLWTGPWPSHARNHRAPSTCRCRVRCWRRNPDLPRLTPPNALRLLPCRMRHPLRGLPATWPARAIRSSSPRGPASSRSRWRFWPHWPSAGPCQWSSFGPATCLCPTPIRCMGAMK